VDKNDCQPQTELHRRSSIPRPYPVFPETAFAYEQRVHSLGRAAYESCPDGDQRLFTLWQLAEYFLSRPWRLSTFRSYRSALLWVMRKSQDQCVAAVRAYEALEAARVPPSGLLPPKKRRPKSIPEDDVVLLEAELARRAERSVWAERTRRLFMAGLATGLRPDEWWKGTQWSESSRTELTVRCGKLHASLPAGKRVREPPPPSAPLIADNRPVKTRSIPVSPLDRDIVELHLRSVHEQIALGAPSLGIRALSSSYYHQCKQVLARTCEALWGGRKRYPLLTARSQYSANMKAAYGSDEAARRMGHLDKTTPATAFYGASSQAHGRFKGLRPSEQVDIRQASHSPARERN
jgi:integrase